jgi:CubicO group peptidase (beta-lactamase class C family)/tetratricopeptide (TPR) repeat protein
VKGFGYADLENKTPMKAESAYRLASVTKPMTAIAVLQLAEQGKLNLDAEVQTYVPYFPKKKWPVTVRQLLGHLGGIPHYVNREAELRIKTRKTTRESIALFENYDLVAEPGTRYSYSSYGYNLLGAVVEAASGQSYGDYMREHVWRPLGMGDTRMDDPVEIIPNRVRGYQMVDGRVANSEFVDISSRFAAGGTRSTVPDLLKFAEGVMQGKLLSKASYDLMYDSMQTREGRFTNYGAGWETSHPNGRFMVAHSGGQNETRTLLWVFPGRNFAVAGAVNFEGSSPYWYMQRLFQLLSDEPFDVSAYTGDRLKDALYVGLRDTFGEGLAHFARHRQPLTKTDAEAAEAFAYFNKHVSEEALRASQQETWRRIREGRHPAGGQSFVKVGSVMAAKLREKYGDARLDTYTAGGPLAFFADYVALYKSQPDFPAALRFGAPLEQTIARWRESWDKANTAYVRGLSVTPDAGADFEAGLRKAFAGAEIYPSFMDDFVTTTRQLVTRGERERALKTARLALDLYPASDTAHVYLAVTQLVFGEGANAAQLVTKAKELNPGGIASAGGLNSLAYELASVNKLDAGLELLKIASALHPQEANLYDSIGEFYVRKGEKQTGIGFYRKALEVNPNLETAKRALEQLTK